MLVNLGLFILVWEVVAVLAMIPVRLAVPEMPAIDLIALGGLTAPAGAWATRLIDRHWLGEARMDDGLEVRAARETEAAMADPQPVEAGAEPPRRHAHPA